MARTYTLPPTYRHKQGDTLELAGPASRTEDGETVTDFTGWTGSSELRDSSGDLAADLNFSWIDITAGTLMLSTNEALSVGTYRFDVEFTSPTGSVISTPTVTVKVTEQVTL